MCSDVQFDEDAPETALLDRVGVVVAANQAWLDLSWLDLSRLDLSRLDLSRLDLSRLDLSRGNSADPGRPRIGASDLAGGDTSAHDPTARQIASAVRAALRGEPPTPPLVRLPHHPPDADRWCDVLGASRHDGWGDCVSATVTLSPTTPSRTAAPRPGDRSRRWRALDLLPAPVPVLVVVARDLLERPAPAPLLGGGPEGYQVAFERAPIGIAVVRLDEHGGRTVLRANQALADLFAEPLDRLVGRDLADYSTADDQAHDRRVVAEMLSGARQTYAGHESYRRADGSRGWAEVRVSRADVPGARGATTLAHLVDVTARHEAETRRARQAEKDAAVAQIATSVLAGTPLPEVYRLIADVTARVFDAETVTLSLLDPRTGTFVPVAAGPPDDVPTPGGLARAVPTAAAGFGRPGEQDGLVTVTRAFGAEPFSEADLALLVGLAQQVGLAVELGRARADQQRLAVLEDRQRIARDLHDTVIQDLIAVGMQLDAGIQRSAGRDPSRSRRDAALIDQLEEAVRRLRGAVFDLREPARDRPLPDALRAIAGEAARVLGHPPSVRITGRADAVPADVGNAVVSVLREGLSNVARHARAGATQVSLVVEPRRLQLTIADDGRGLPEVLVPGDGIVNVRQRAAALRGAATVEPLPDGGTRLVWSCPLALAPATASVDSEEF